MKDAEIKKLIKSGIKRTVEIFSGDFMNKPSPVTMQLFQLCSLFIIATLMNQGDKRAQEMKGTIELIAEHFEECKKIHAEVMFDLKLELEPVKGELK